MKKILVTGNLGYIGSVLTDMLIEKNYSVTGFDIGYYEETLISKCKYKTKQIYGDIRDINSNDIKYFDIIIHLAAISNDPLGALSPNVTEEINFISTLKLANLAKENATSRFIFASSQSMYGISNIDKPLEEESSEKNPITIYALTKFLAENELKKLNSKDFTVVMFRPSTVFGVSPRMRCDIVFNNLIGNAFTTKKIEIKGNGKPFRPVIHVKDLCSAFIAGIIAPKSLVENQAYNVGIENGNYTVLELAKIAKKYVPGSEILIKNELGKDERTYKVSFKKILNDLKNYYNPVWNLDSGAREILDFFKKINFDKDILYGWKTNRLYQIKRLQESKMIDEKLRKK